MARWDNFVKSIGINTATRFIPVFLEEADNITHEWQQHGQFDMVHEGLHLLVRTMCKIILGDQFLQKFGPVDIETRNGVQ